MDISVRRMEFTVFRREQQEHDAAYEELIASIEYVLFSNGLRLKQIELSSFDGMPRIVLPARVGRALSTHGITEREVSTAILSTFDELDRTYEHSNGGLVVCREGILVFSPK